MSSGSIIGDIGIANGGVRTADVIADTECVIRHVTAADLAALETEDPALALALQRALMLALAAKLATANRVAEWSQS